MKTSSVEAICIVMLQVVGLSRALRCNVCKQAASTQCTGADDMGTPEDCSEGENRCYFQVLEQSSTLYFRGCWKGEVSNEGCYWTEGEGSGATCYCNTDGCNNRNPPTKPTAKAITCHDCSNLDGRVCTSIDHVGSTKACDPSSGNSCVKAYGEEGGAVMNVNRYCFGFANADYCERTTDPDNGRKQTKCYCTSDRCNAGGVERFGGKVPKCPPK